MASKKAEGQMDVFEEQLGGVQGDLMGMKGEVQKIGLLEARLGTIESKLDAWTEQLGVLEKIERMLQRGEMAGKGTAISSGAETPVMMGTLNFGSVSTAVAGNSAPRPTDDHPLKQGREEVPRNTNLEGSSQEIRLVEKGKMDALARRLEMPIFEGWNPEGWLFRVERFFSVHRMTEEEKLVAAAIHLEGEALAWFQWEESQRPMRRWSDLKDRLLDRFRPTQEGSLCEQFLSLRQEGTVRDYIRAFEVMAASLIDVPSHVQESSFINGLHSEIRAEVRMMKPVGLRETMKLAQRVEERNWACLAGMGCSNNTPPHGPSTGDGYSSGQGSKWRGSWAGNPVGFKFPGVGLGPGPLGHSYASGNSLNPEGPAVKVSGSPQPVGQLAHPWQLPSNQTYKPFPAQPTSFSQPNPPPFKQLA